MQDDQGAIANWSILTKCKHNNDIAAIVVSSTSKLVDYQKFLVSKFKNIVAGTFELRYSITNDHERYFLTSDEDMYTMVASAFFEKSHTTNIYIVDILPLSGGSSSTQFLLTDNSTSVDLYENDLNEEYMGIYRPNQSEQLKSAAWLYNIIEVGQKFNSGVVEFREKLREFALESGFVYIIKKNDKTRFTAVCKDKDCKWRIHASNINSGLSFYIKKYNPIHTCLDRLRKPKGELLSSKIITSLYKEKIQKEPFVTAKDIEIDFKENYGYEVPYQMAWRAKENALSKYIGDKNSCYNHFYWYLQEMMKNNKNSWVKLEKHPETNRFERVFICFEGTIEGFKYCRPLLFLDGTFLRGTYKGAMLSATGKTGNEDFYPFSFAICSGETDDNWFWFLENLASILNPQGRDVTFVSDRHSGLTKGIPKYFPSGYHSFCRNHLKKNLATTYAKSLPKPIREGILKAFVECMLAPTEVLFDHNLRLLQNMGGKRVEDFLNEIPYNNWASAHFKGKRYREFDNNVAESFNMWIKKERGLQIYDLVDRLRSRLMNYNAEKLLQSTKWHTILCKEKQKWLDHMLKKGSVYVVRECNPTLYEVRCEHTHCVDLINWTCTCQQWQQRGFFCSHAVAAIQKSQLNMYDFVEKYFTTDYYMKAYETPIIPSTDIEQGIISYDAEIILRPPETRRPPGRPAGRKRSHGEKRRKVNSCSRCGENSYHNRKTCTAPINN